mmetsp:Transcript_7113/g.12885  ORF Transcript_7113/g.12885 Transcript_7113/m.12885 type:complete len:85 (+) Transcript_7113:1198-1452(+)
MGHPPSMYALGKCCEYGLGSHQKPSVQAALVYHSQATSCGFDDSRREERRLESKFRDPTFSIAKASIQRSFDPTIKWGALVDIV